jgi:hypothetical protein
VMEVVPGRRFAFQLVSERVEAEIELNAIEHGHTRVGLVVDAPWGVMKRTFPQQTLARLYDILQTSADG